MSTVPQPGAKTNPSANPSREIEADYLVVGAGAMGMAFADEILEQSKSARVVVVDRRARPGGHWNDAYRFVTLHQPALYYGVNSMQLGAGGRDLVSQAQILAYYELVQKKLEATGRFQLLRQCDYQGDGRIVSLTGAGLDYRVRARKLVDASYMDVQVPSTTPPKYAVGPDASLVPINGLATRTAPARRYVVIGAGKTGIDAALYLLEQGVEPGAITWVMPNDAWFLNRDALQPDGLADEFITQLRILSDAESLSQALTRLEAKGRVLRLDREITPTKYRCATVTADELEALRKIEDIERRGRVVAIEGNRLRLEQGERVFDEPVADLLFVDCSADGLAKRPARPIFEGDRITLQSISMCQQVMSAAAIAKIEASSLDEEERNRIAVPVPHPVVPADYLHAITTTLRNQQSGGRVLFLWALRKRLSAAAHMGLGGVLRFMLTVVKHPIPSEERVRELIEAG